jgi:hypothetical protein
MFYPVNKPPLLPLPLYRAPPPPPGVSFISSNQLQYPFPCQLFPLGIYNNQCMNKISINNLVDFNNDQGKKASKVKSKNQVFCFY